MPAQVIVQEHALRVERLPDLRELRHLGVRLLKPRVADRVCLGPVGATIERAHDLLIPCPEALVGHGFAIGPVHDDADVARVDTVGRAEPDIILLDKANLDGEVDLEWGRGGCLLNQSRSTRGGIALANQLVRHTAALNKLVQGTQGLGGVAPGDGPLVDVLGKEAVKVEDLNTVVDALQGLGLGGPEHEPGQSWDQAWDVPANVEQALVDVEVEPVGRAPARFRG